MIWGSSPFSARTLPPTPRPTITYRNDVIELSRTNFAQDREGVEKNIMDWFGKDSAPVVPEKPKKQFVDPGAQYAQPQRMPQPVPEESVTITDVEPVAQQQTTPVQKEWNQKPRVTATVPRTQMPFKKAFTATPPAVYLQEIEKGTSTPARAFRPISRANAPIKKPMPGVVINTPAPQPVAQPTTAVSPALTELLASIDGSVAKTIPTPIETPVPTPAPATPFSGEKPLRDTIPPVKLGERGPTEKNRDLLKAALMSAVADSQKKEVPVTPAVSVTPVPTPAQPSESVATAPVTPPQPAPVPPAPQSTTAVAIQPEEIPYQELRKILE